MAAALRRGLSYVAQRKTDRHHDWSVIVGVIEVIDPELGKEFEALNERVLEATAKHWRSLLTPAAQTM
ncbi:hypothetical protein G7048_19170 [Diaphorobacter sp. HDW4B]|uniref:hypothetical protein n=1 Tax=Diaphorobacter sp. HDW4B TaxID=2714925 RepID=UPI00140AB764|nr:hypothetical protein [Diaphorobacter sp. HDW4B]QIL72287.1 hypothetical protein G7048_19170 [Diaphorobacter sp. HDW4B]